MRILKYILIMAVITLMPVLSDIAIATETEAETAQAAATYVIPANIGIMLIFTGIALMITEGFIPSFGIIGFSGLVSLIAGLSVVSESEAYEHLNIDGGIIAAVAVLGALIIGIIVYVTIKAYKKESDTGTEGMVGKTAEIVEWKNDHGRVRVQGEVWQAYADTVLDLKKGEDVTVSKVEDHDLKVKIIKQS